MPPAPAVLLITLVCLLPACAADEAFLARHQQKEEQERARYEAVLGESPTVQGCVKAVAAGAVALAWKGGE